MGRPYRIQVRLEDEIEWLIENFCQLRRAFEIELKEHTDAGRHVPTALNKKGLELAKAFETLVSSKVRYDKSRKELAERMTPEEEQEATLAYVKGLGSEERYAWLTRLNTWLRANNEDPFTRTSLSYSKPSVRDEPDTD